MGTIDLMQNISAETITPLDNEVLHAPEAIYKFTFDIFQNSFRDGENTMLSPISIISALAMTANGAKNDTLKQMEEVFGISIDELNFFLHNYIKNLPQESTNKLNIANSIWIKNDNKLVVKEDFLQKNAAYYDAGIFNADFDAQTLQDINQWIEDNTDGMIKDMLDAIPQEAIMYLINALSFKAEWQNTYFEHQVRDGVFTNSDGKKEDAKLMFSSEKSYLELENAQGFIKFYKDNEYALAAILPDEGIALKDYIKQLDPAALLDTIKNSHSVKVNAAIPKFESEYSVELNEILQNLGMTDAFDGEKADFTTLGLYGNGENNIYISRVLHKTFIALDEKGTEAGAATIVEMAKATSLRPPEEIKTVYLDRPFIYMIIDCENMLPLFIGAIETLE
ncbi:MAG: serpin family protein [Firmicutes bacterium]|nr:serpin family protein [Bacillota bacterium]